MDLVATEAIKIYIELVQIAVPIAVVFALGDKMVGWFLNAALNGKLWLGR